MKDRRKEDKRSHPCTGRSGATELELSMQDQGALVPSLLAPTICRIVPYVPRIMMTVPVRITKLLQTTMSVHIIPRFLRPQLSYSHMIPYGWKQSIVPNVAPISATREPKIGMALATM